MVYGLWVLVASQQHQLMNEKPKYRKENEDVLFSDQ